jgi:hypothetical protein
MSENISGLNAEIGVRVDFYGTFLFICLRIIYFDAMSNGLIAGWCTRRPSQFMKPLGLLLGLLLFLGGSCGNVGVENITIYNALDSAQVVATSPDSKPALPNPPITPGMLALLKPADGFDYPVGPPHAEGYYKFRGFLPRGLEHLGEDWNGVGGGNSDFGDYVYAVADGVAFSADSQGPGWGIVIRILHNYGTTENPYYIESVYAHVESAWVRSGFRVKRGEKVGTMGTASNKYHAHLHFEMRKEVGKTIGCGYAGDTAGFVDPTVFISSHRPRR